MLGFSLRRPWPGPGAGNSVALLVSLSFRSLSFRPERDDSPKAKYSAQWRNLLSRALAARIHSGLFPFGMIRRMESENRELRAAENWLPAT